MPICNPIKRSAALLQSRYDSLRPRGTDRDSGAAPCLEEGVGRAETHKRHIAGQERRNKCACSCVCVSSCVCACMLLDLPQQDQK